MRSGGGVATDPRLKEAIEDLTREHVEIEAARRQTARWWKRTRR